MHFVLMPTEKFYFKVYICFNVIIKLHEIIT